MFLCGFPNSPKDIASSIVDLPQPFGPTTNVDLFLLKSISVKLLPVDKKFFHFTLLNFIISKPEQKELQLIIH